MITRCISVNGMAWTRFSSLTSSPHDDQIPAVPRPRGGALEIKEMQGRGSRRHDTINGPLTWCSRKMHEINSTEIVVTVPVVAEYSIWKVFGGGRLREWGRRGDRNGREGRQSCGAEICTYLSGPTVLFCLRAVVLGGVELFSGGYADQGGAA